MASSLTDAHLLPAVPVQVRVVAAAACLMALVLWQASSFGWRMPALALVGGALGAALYFASFGFASAYRRFLVAGETRGVEAQLLLVALTMLLLAPMLATGSVLGNAVSGAVAPAGVQVAVGAFLFGVGMQLGGGCASGTLYTAGSGNLRMVVTLLAFCGGAFWASLHLDFWTATPQLPPIALGEVVGWPVAVILQLGVVFAVWLVVRWIARGRRLAVRDATGSLWRGPWPLVGGAVALAVLNAATLAIAHHPWAITWGYTLWGAKLAAVAGWTPAAGGLWSSGYFRNALLASPLADTVSIMNIGILIGAMLAVGLAGQWAPQRRIPVRSLIAALAGGLLLGYGARIAFGCNIGAFVSGVGSTSLHGWLWILCAMPGNWLGIRLRPAFGLSAD